MLTLAEDLVSFWSRRLPTPSQTKFLRFCLAQTRAEQRQTWRQFQAATTPLEAEFTGTRVALSSLLAIADPLLRAASIDVPRSFRGYLRVVRHRETARSERVFAVLERLMMAFRAAGLEPRLRGGLAFALGYYPEPQVRHCGSIELALPFASMSKALQVAQATHLALDSTGPGRHQFVDCSGLRVNLARDWPLPFQSNATPFNTARHVKYLSFRSLELRVAEPLAMLAERLEQVVVSRELAALRWVFDAATLLAAEPDLCWRSWLAGMQSSPVGLLVGCCLQYLREELGLPVPAFVVEGLSPAKLAAGRDTVAWAYAGLRASGLSHPQVLFGATDRPRLRRAFLAEALVPESRCLAHTRGIEGQFALAGYYLRRPVGAFSRWFVHTARG